MKANCCQIFGEMPFAMTSFLTTAPPLSKRVTVAAVHVTHTCSAAGLSAPCYVEQIGIGRNKESGTFY